MCFFNKVLFSSFVLIYTVLFVFIEFSYSETTLCIKSSCIGRRNCPGINVYKKASTSINCSSGYSSIVSFNRSEIKQIAQTLISEATLQISNPTISTATSSSPSNSSVSRAEQLGFNPRGCFASSLSTAWLSTYGVPLESVARHSVSVSCSSLARLPGDYIMIDSSIKMTTSPKDNGLWSGSAGEGLTQIPFTPLLEYGALQKLTEKNFLLRSIQTSDSTSSEILDGVAVVSEVNASALQNYALLINTSAEARLTVGVFCCPLVEN